MSEHLEGMDPSAGPAPAQLAPRARGTLAAAVLGAVGAVLVALYAFSSVTVAADGRLIEPFGALALGMLALTGAGIFGLARMFSSMRRARTCGRGGC